MEKIKCFGFDMDYTLAGKETAFSILTSLTSYLSAACLVYSQLFLLDVEFVLVNSDWTTFGSLCNF